MSPNQKVVCSTQNKNQTVAEAIYWVKSGGDLLEAQDKREDPFGKLENLPGNKGSSH
jgi:hypothetical protein